MLVQTVADHVEEHHEGVFGEKQIDKQIIRDKVLYGNPYQECTGIIITCWASVGVIRKAAKCGANPIIAHKTLFRSHGDHADWLQEKNNQPLLAEKKLLNEAGIVVQKNHDYIYSGIPVEDDSYADGIFYGVAGKLDWTQYIIKDTHHLLHLTISRTAVKELADFLIQKLQLDDVKTIGSKNSTIGKIRIPFRILGDARDSIREANQENINCYLIMEVVDFTLAEYTRDSSILDTDKAVISMGHFNLEEPGMEYMITYLSTAVKADVPYAYIQSGDMYDYGIQQHRRHTQKPHK